MAKVTHTEEGFVSKYVEDIVNGTVFSWGCRDEWYIMTVDGAFSLGDGENIISEGDLMKYIEATSIEIKTGGK